MARTKGMLNLSGNLEVNAQAPLDARTIVPTEADLTVASNFPYPYVGLEVYVIGTNKKFRLVNLDTTQSSSWYEIGEGGGGGETYSDFTGATSSTAGAHGLVPAPSAGDEGKVLFGNGLWGNIVMPSVDLSNSSVESDILDTTEKAIGTTTDGYLIYQKVVSTGGSVPSGATLLMRVQLQNSTDIIRYTKTTDSPLASDVKFAGVDENGNVLLKKHVVTTTPTSPTTMAMYTDANAIIKDVSMPYFDMGSDGFFTMLHSGLCNYTISANRHSVNGWISSGASNFTNKPCEFDVYFTLAS